MTSKITLFIITCLISLSLSQNQYEFYIDNTYDGNIMNGSYYFPFTDISQSLSFITNTTEASLTYYLVSSDISYHLVMDTLQPLSLSISTCLNCTSTTESSLSKISIDINIVNSSSFNFSLQNLIIVSNSVGEQSVFVNCSDIQLNYTNIFVSTSQQLSHTFYAFSLWGSITSLSYEALNLNNIFLTIQTELDAYLSISDLNCSNFNSGILFLASNNMLENSTFLLDGASLSTQLVETTPLNPLFTFSNIYVINITNINYTYNSPQICFSLLNSNRELNIENILISGLDQESAIWIAIDSQNSSIENWISLDSITVENSNFKSIMFISNSTNTQTNVNFTNLEVSSSLISSIYDSSFLESSIQDEKIYYNFENWLLTSSQIIQMITIEFEKMSYNYFYINLTNIKVHNTDFLGNSQCIFFDLVNSSYIFIYNLTFENVNLNKTTFIEESSPYGHTKLQNCKVINTTLTSAYFLNSIDNLGWIHTKSIYDKLISIRDCVFNNISASGNYSFIYSSAIKFEISNNIFKSITLGYRGFDFKQFSIISGPSHKTSNFTSNIFSEMEIYRETFLKLNLINSIVVNISGNVYDRISSSNNFIDFEYVETIDFSLENENSVSSHFNNFIFNTGKTFSANISSILYSSSTFGSFFTSLASGNLSNAEIKLTNMTFANSVSKVLFDFENYNKISDLIFENFIGNNISLSPILPESTLFLLRNTKTVNFTIKSATFNGIYYTPAKINHIASPRMNLLQAEQEIKLFEFEKVQILNTFFGINLTNLIILRDVLELVMTDFYLQNIFLFNTNGYLLDFCTPSLSIINFTLIDPNIDIYNFFTGGKGFIQNSYVNSENYSAVFTNFFIQNWLLEDPLISLINPIVNLTMKNFTAIKYTQILYINSFGGNLQISDILIGMAKGSFLKVKKSKSVPSNVTISNFTLLNTALVHFHQFEIQWTDVNMYMFNISTLNTPLLYLEAKTCSFKIDSFIAFGDLALNHFQFVISPSDLMSSSVEIAKGIVQNTTGKFLVELNSTSQACYLVLSNLIIEDSNISLYCNFNSNVKIYNLIQKNSQFHVSSYDSAFNLSSATIIENATFMYLQSKEMFMELRNKTLNFTSSILLYNRPTLMINSKMIVNSSLFLFNINIENLGGCISGQSSSLDIYDSTLQYNIALIGGAVYLDTGILDFDNLYLMQNVAQLYGNNWASAPWNVELSINSSITPDSLFKEYDNVQLDSLFSGFLLSKYVISNASYSFALNNFYVIQLFDYFSQPIRFSPQSYPFVADILNPRNNEQNSVIIPNFSFYGEFLASNISIPPIYITETNIISVRYNNYDALIQLEITSRGCLPGEEYNTILGACVLCEINTYSLAANDTCLNCPTGGICPGGSFIYSQEYYWLEPGTASIYQCLNDSIPRCQGNIDPNLQCLEGYSGGLCLGCDYKAAYSQGLAHICSSCDESVIWLMFNCMILFLLSLGYELVILYLTYRSNKLYIKKIEKKDQSDFEYDFGLNCQLLVLNTFLQIVYILFNYIWNLENSLIIVIDKLEFLLSIASAQPQSSSNFACLLLRLGIDPDSVTYYQVVVQAILPFVKIMILICLLMLRNTRKKLKNLRAKIIWVIVIIVSLDQTGILLFLSKFSLCSFEGLKGYSLLDPNISCSSESYQNFTWFFVYPTIILWGILIPLVFGLYFYRLRNKIQDVNVRRILGSLMNSFTDDAYFWNLIIMLLKMSMIILLTFFEPKNASNFCMVIAISYFYFLFHKKPLIDQSMNRTNELCALAIFICTYFFNQALDNSQIMIVIYLVLIILISGFIIIYLILKVILTLRKKQISILSKIHVDRPSSHNTFIEKMKI